MKKTTRKSAGSAAGGKPAISTRIKWLVKKYWIEFVLLFILTVAVMFAWKNVFAPQTAKELASIEYATLQFAMSFLPLAIAVVAGWLAAGKARRFKEALALSTSVLGGYTIVALCEMFANFAFLPQDIWETQFEAVSSELAITATPDTFKAMFFYELGTESLRELGAMIGFALVGAWIGWKLRRKFGK